KSMQITVRFPVAGWWRRFRKGKQGVISMVFPDPSGELLQNLEEAYFVNYLSHARAIMLMVDPNASEKTKKKKKLVLENAAIPLQALIDAVRNETGRREGLLNKQLAVIVTKFDEEGVIGLD